MEINKKILLVDDDPNFREIWKNKLLIEGFEVIEANDGQEALKILENYKPDLILLDILMPHMNGVEFFLTVKENPEFQNIKIIFITSMDEDSEDFELISQYHKKIAEEIGAFDYLTKTADLDHLIEKVKKALNIQS